MRENCPLLTQLKCTSFEQRRIHRATAEVSARLEVLRPEQKPLIHKDASSHASSISRDGLYRFTKKGIYDGRCLSE